MLQQSEFQTIYNQLDESICVLDKTEGQFTSVNTPFEVFVAKHFSAEVAREVAKCSLLVEENEL